MHPKRPILLQIRGIKNLVTALLAAASCSSLVSCGFVKGLFKGKDEPVVEEPVSQPVVKAPPAAPQPAADPTDMFLTPKDDHLPTNAQLAQGADSSIGTGTQPDNNAPSGPSTTAKPPKPETPGIDQLDPGE